MARQQEQGSEETRAALEKEYQELGREEKEKWERECREVCKSYKNFCKILHVYNTISIAFWGIFQLKSQYAHDLNQFFESLPDAERAEARLRYTMPNVKHSELEDSDKPKKVSLKKEERAAAKRAKMAAAVSGFRVS